MADNFFGKYRGEVVNVNDPEHSGRIKVTCPKVLGEQISNWALPNLPPYYSCVPKVGTMVWVEFEEGRKDAPIWTGCFYTAGQWSEASGGGDSRSMCFNVPGGIKFSCSEITSNQKFPESKHADIAGALG